METLTAYSWPGNIPELDGSEHTLEEISWSLAVTRERIRQIEARALGKWRPSAA